jgi:hypothetical protein
MKRGEVGWKTTPHKLSHDRIMLIDVVSGTRNEVPADPDKPAGRIQWRRNSSTEVEVDLREVLGWQWENKNPTQ